MIFTRKGKWWKESPEGYRVTVSPSERSSTRWRYCAFSPMVFEPGENGSRNARPDKILLGCRNTVEAAEELCVEHYNKSGTHA